MNQEQLIIIIASFLGASFISGWLAHFLVTRVKYANYRDIKNTDDITAKLHETEEELEHYKALYAERERELLGQVSQLSAEVQAAMDGLGNARRIADEYRRELEALREG